MTIRTRLFVGSTLLVLALVGVQWSLHAREVAALHREIEQLAGRFGESLVLSGEAIWLAARPPVAAVPANEQGDGARTQREQARSVSTIKVVRPHASSGEGDVVFHRVFVAAHGARPVLVEPPGAAHVDPLVGDQAGPEDASGPIERSERVEVKVLAEAGAPEKLLVIRNTDGEERRFLVPVAPTERVLRGTFRQGLLASGLLLGAGILGAALLAQGVSRPVRQLAAGFEAVGGGGFGTRVEVSGAGEIGELQRRFNQMSERLATLERERQTWAARAHLAELGALAAGLAHTLRNPLNTLGLAVEELAGRSGADESGLVATARSQIRRIDRWVLSFLALGAGRAAEPESLDLRELARAAVLEAVQAGGDVRFAAPADAVPVDVVPRALQAALANLLENAVQASPAGQAVEVGLEATGGEAVVTITDRGAGLPAEVREKLFQPHVSSRPGGAGMGLYLARQLVEAGNGGGLEIRDAPGGGTQAVVRLPLGTREPS